jgi:hypothetical protein
MTDNTSLMAGCLYTADELPENQMNNSGKLEGVGYNLLALATEDGIMAEFKHAYECTAVYKMDDDGGVGEVLSGDPCPLGRDHDDDNSDS